MACVIELSDEEPGEFPPSSSGTGSSNVSPLRWDSATSDAAVRKAENSPGPDQARLSRCDSDVLELTPETPAFVKARAAQASADEALALQLQREEEHAAEARAQAQHGGLDCKRPRDTVIIGDDAMSLMPPISKAPRSKPSDLSEPRFNAEKAPASPDGVALLRGCFSRAPDVRRSDIHLGGSTPFFLQHRKPRGHGPASFLAMPSMDGASADHSGSGGVGGSAHIGGGSRGSTFDCDSPDATWSCGYRNLQMLIGHLLLQAGLQHIFGGIVPDIPSLQAELERLWRLGYDPEGCAQLGGSVLGTKKWIGTSEACVLLRGQGVRCNIVAFRGRGGSSSTGCSSDGCGLGREAGPDCAASALMERAMNHFGSGSPGSVQPPLYLQHDGHSRTVVGVQRRREPGGQCTDFLLVLDPGLGEHGFEEFTAAALRGRGWERYVKRSLAPLRKKPEYELLVVEADGSIGPESLAAAKCVARWV